MRHILDSDGVFDQSLLVVLDAYRGVYTVENNVVALIASQTYVLSDEIVISTHCEDSGFVGQRLI